MLNPGMATTVEVNADQNHSPRCKFVFSGLIAACCVFLMSCDQPEGAPPDSFQTFEATIDHTGIKLTGTAPAWIDDHTVAYQRDDGYLVIRDLVNDEERDVRKVMTPPCATIDGTVRAVYRADPADKYSVHILDIKDGEHRVIDAYVENVKSLRLSNYGCHIEQVGQGSSLELTMPIRDDGYIYAERNEGGTSVRTNIYTPNRKPRLIADLLYYHSVLQFLPWKNAYFLQTNAWKGHTRLYMINREDWSTQSLEKPAIEVAPNQEFIFTRAGLIYAPQLFRDGFHNPKLAGLYWVDPDSGTLSKIFEGQMAMPTVSPSGCRIAVSHGHDIEDVSAGSTDFVLINVCKSEQKT